MRPSFKRFYQNVSLTEESGEQGWQLLLDGKPVKTLAGRRVAMAYLPLAEAIVEEWRAQDEMAELASMPMTRSVMRVLDHVGPRMAAVCDEALAYGRTDLLCYRAGGPEGLARRQAEAWQGHLDWAADALGARLRLTEGVTAIGQEPAALAALEQAATSLDPYRLLVLHGLTTRFGSLVLALAVLHGQVIGAEAFAASRVDELYQAEIWGKDEIAEERAASIAREVAELERFLSVLA